MSVAASDLYMDPVTSLRANASLLIMSRALPEPRADFAAQHSGGPGFGDLGLRSGPDGLIRAALARRAATWLGLASGSASAGPYSIGPLHCQPVEASAEERAGCDGFARQAIWPLYHQRLQAPRFLQRWWEPYESVNRRMAAVAAETVERGGSVWVHDVDLQLVPAELRRRRPDTTIGFFLHTPFPSVEWFARLPWRRQVLAGLLGADAIGFQSEADAQRFATCARRFVAARGADLELEVDGRPVRLFANPIGVDVRLHEAFARNPDLRVAAERIRRSLGGRRLLLAVDRLDATADPAAALRAFAAMLSRDPSLAGRAAMVQIAIPDGSPQGAAAGHEAERVAECIASLYGAPVARVLGTGLGAAELATWFVACDLAIVGSLSEGESVLAKEFVATRVDGGGFLLLSEFAGAERELAEAIRFNPYDRADLCASFRLALGMASDEARRRMLRMRSRVRHNDAHAWADRCLEFLRERRRFVRARRSSPRIAAVAAKGGDAV